MYFFTVWAFPFIAGAALIAVLHQRIKAVLAFAIPAVFIAYTIEFDPHEVWFFLFPAGIIAGMWAMYDLLKPLWHTPGRLPSLRFLRERSRQKDAIAANNLRA